jgi:hypothetical protein
MAVLDLTEAVDRVRLMVGDVTDLEIFPDNVYEYYLSKNNNNENIAAKEVAYAILAVLSQNTRSRLDRIEVFGNLVFEQYLTFLKEYIKNPNGPLSLGGIYVAGNEVADVVNNMNDDTMVQKRMPFGGKEGQYTVLLNPYDTDEHF